MRRHHSALFPYDGSISFDKLGQGLVGFIYVFPNYACCWELVGISFCGPCATLFYWCGLSNIILVFDVLGEDNPRVV